MKSENFEERKKLLKRFVLLYLASLVLLVLAFYALPGREEAPGDPVPALSTHDDHSKAVSEGLKMDLQSALRQTEQLRRELAVKDSQLRALAIEPMLKPVDNADDEYLALLQKNETASRETLRQVQDENAGLQQKLADQVNSGTALKDQVANLQHLNETLRGRLSEVSTRGAQPDGAELMSGNAHAERQAEMLNAELQLAEANCDLSRADARQIVYNAKQRQELLKDALLILNQLVQSPDAGIQEKAKQKIIELRNIVSTVHD